MYPLGFLFGLGFDTATEVGLLGISAAEAAKGLSIWSILVFPALFTAGMSLMDTSDGVLMTGRLRLGLRQADPQALLQPDHHLRFGDVAVVIGGIEALGLIGDSSDWMAGSGMASARSTTISARSATPSSACSSSVGSISAAIYRIKGYDQIGANA